MPTLDERRQEAARKALEAYTKSKDNVAFAQEHPGDRVAHAKDLITDVMHYLWEQENIDPRDVVNGARNNYDAERAGIE